MRRLPAPAKHSLRSALTSSSPLHHISPSHAATSSNLESSSSSPAATNRPLPHCSGRSRNTAISRRRPLGPPPSAASHRVVRLGSLPVSHSAPRSRLGPFIPSATAGASPGPLVLAVAAPPADAERAWLELWPWLGSRWASFGLGPGQQAWTEIWP